MSIEDILADPNADPERLHELAQVRAIDIVAQVAQHPRTALDTLWYLVVNDTRVHSIIADRDDLHPSLCWALARSADWYVRATIAGHPNTPQDCRRQLCEDADRMVRRIAWFTLFNLLEDNRQREARAK